MNRLPPPYHGPAGRRPSLGIAGTLLVLAVVAAVMVVLAVVFETPFR